jgi:hypothetical protein
MNVVHGLSQPGRAAPQGLEEPADWRSATLSMRKGGTRDSLTVQGPARAERCRGPGHAGCERNAAELVPRTRLGRVRVDGETSGLEWLSSTELS